MNSEDRYGPTSIGGSEGLNDSEEFKIVTHVIRRALSEAL